MGIEINVEGTDASIRGLDDFEQSIIDKIFRQVKDSTVNIETKTKQNTPVKTGTLKGSYTHTFQEDNKKVIGEVGTDVPYAPMVEFGTSKQGAQPHLIPAFEDEMRSFNDLIEIICRG